MIDGELRQQRPLHLQPCQHQHARQGQRDDYPVRLQVGEQPPHQAPIVCFT